MEDQDRKMKKEETPEITASINENNAGNKATDEESLDITTEMTDNSYTPDATDTPEKKIRGKKRKDTFREYAEAIITAIILALIIRAVVVQAFKIPSGSMLETLQIGDHLLVNKFLYGIDLPFTDKKIFAFRTPEKGDIIVFKYPEDPRRDFIKRVIAASGDTIEGRNRIIYINGSPTKEPYVIHTASTILPHDVSKRDNFGPITVPEGKVFMMGDNRENSLDSRFWGFVDHEAVRGKAFIIYWSQDGNLFKPRWGRIGNLIH